MRGNGEEQLIEPLFLLEDLMKPERLMRELLASMVNDMDWQHEICAEIDRINDSTKKRKKPRKTTSSD